MNELTLERARCRGDRGRRVRVIQEWLTSFSCDLLAASAQEHGRLLRGGPGLDRGRITPGSLFLVRRSPQDWQHVGIVTATELDSIATIEGNTNDTGSADGYEVCRRTRGYTKKDFILL